MTAPSPQPAPLVVSFSRLRLVASLQIEVTSGARDHTLIGELVVVNFVVGQEDRPAQS
jgi:hypothetical protein